MQQLKNQTFRSGATSPGFAAIFAFGSCEDRPVWATRVPGLAAWVHRAPTLRLEVNDVRPWTPIMLFLAVVSGDRDRRAAAFASLDRV